MTQLLSTTQKQTTKKLLRLRAGAGETISFNPQEGQIVLKEHSGLRLICMKDEEEIVFEPDQPVLAPLSGEGIIYVEALSEGHHSAELVHLLPDGTPNESLIIKTYDFEVRLSVDSNRDGIVDNKDIGRANWIYGKAQQGAILLINNDLDISDKLPVNGEQTEWSELRIAPVEGMSELPPELNLVLQVPPRVAECCSIYRKDEAGDFHHILGKNLQDAAAPTISISAPLPIDGADCFIEAHEYPGDFFEGLITLQLLMKFGDETIASDRAVYRVAPWMMTPNTLIPAEVYACEMADNQDFLSDLKSALDELQIPLTVIPEQGHRGDRWIQDEIEFGYIQGAGHTIPVVFDSPRDRGLAEFPKSLLGPDFGHFQIGNNSRNSLDSFGNLEVSPPVTANGRHYPFGRIVIGGRRRGDYSEQSRQMMPELRHFLYAQKIQAPFELYTDWLGVGHVDEIISFIPADNDKKFQVLIASPLNANIILKRLADRGYAETVMFEGMKTPDYDGPPGTYKSAEITIGELLQDIAFWEANQRYQSYLNLNIEILRRELGIDGRHIVNIPVLFRMPADYDGRTGAYFPNMVNHLVLGNTSLVPKPKGPIINGKCAFETAFEHAVPGRNVRFIENWYSYHKMDGEVHCGTNTRRHPFPNERWWEYKPDGGFDI